MTSNCTATDHHVDTPEGTLFARRWLPDGAEGSDTTIILLHDSLGSVELWRDFPENLAIRLGLPVVAYDRLGFGKSDAHQGKLHADFIRDEACAGLSRVIAALGLREIILCGHSVGGGMAIAGGSQFPGKTRAVIAVSAQAFVEDRTVEGVSEAKRAFEARDQFDRLVRYHGDKARWVLDAWTETWLSPDRAGWTLDDDVRRLHYPLLVIHGDRDEYASEAHPQRIVSLSAGPIKVAIMGDCGHIPQRDAQSFLLELIKEFISKT